MYSVGVRREFVARHALVGGDWGEENEIHGHDYRVEVQLDGATLDEHGYLVDIVEIEEALDGLVERFRNRILNELPEFRELNPSIEHFSRVFCQMFSLRICQAAVRGITVKIWEGEDAWASFHQEF